MKLAFSHASLIAVLFIDFCRVFEFFFFFFFRILQMFSGGGTVCVVTISANFTVILVFKVNVTA